MLRIVIAPDSFKGSLTAKEAVQAISAGIMDIMPEAVVFPFPIADGGEGTTECIVDAMGGRLIEKTVTGPLGHPVDGFFGVLDKQKTAVIEVASASGLGLIASADRNPLHATSFGTGELIRAALDEGCDEIFIGLGGSATNDAGAGILQALGAHLLDEKGREIGLGAVELFRLARIDLADLDKRLAQTRVILGCDVNNLLYGPAGASAVYGPQKGATPEMIPILDAALYHFAEVAKGLGKDIAHVPGAGAAGGIAAGLLLLDARITSGLEKILEITGLETVFQGGVDLLLTGEGEFNGQSLHGKVPVGVARLAKKYAVPVVVLTGSVGSGIEEASREGILAVVGIVPGPVSLDAAIAHAALNLRRTSSMVMRLIALGRQIRKPEHPMEMNMGNDE